LKKHGYCPEMKYVTYTIPKYIVLSSRNVFTPMLCWRIEIGEFGGTLLTFTFMDLGKALNPQLR
jgi:hypothetical protein